MRSDLAMYAEELKDSIETLRNRQVAGSTDNICGYCYDNGFIDSLKNTLQRVEFILDYEDAQD